MSMQAGEEAADHLISSFLDTCRWWWWQWYDDDADDGENGDDNDNVGDDDDDRDVNEDDKWEVI